MSGVYWAIRDPWEAEIAIEWAVSNSNWSSSLSKHKELALKFEYITAQPQDNEYKRSVAKI